MVEKINKTSPIQEKVKANNNIFFVKKSSLKYTYKNKNGIRKGFKQSDSVSKLNEIRTILIIAIIKNPLRKSSFFINYSVWVIGVGFQKSIKTK